MKAVYVRDSFGKRGQSWRLSYHAVYEDGTRGPRRWRTLKEKGKRAANAEADALLALLAAESKEEPPSPTLRSLYEEYIERQASTGSIEQSTYAGYLHNARMLGWIGNKHVADITEEDTARYIGELKSEGYAPSSIKEQLRVVQKTLTRAIEEGYIRKNPARGLRGPKSRETKPSALTADETQHLIEVADGLTGYLPVAIMLALSTGMRRGEACGLTWRDIDFEKGQILIDKSIAMAEDGSWYIKEPKTPRSRRRLPLEPHLGNRLKSRKVSQMRICDDSHSRFHESMFVLGDIDGSFRDPNELTRSFGTVARAFGIANGECGFHWLRHTFATRMFERGVDVRTVSAWLGHADPSITLRYYVDLNETALAESVREVAAFLYGDAAVPGTAAVGNRTGITAIAEEIKRRAQDVKDGGSPPGARDLAEWAVRLLASISESA